MANKKISELPYINGGEISGNTLVPLVTYFSATTGDTVHTYVSDLQTYLTSGITASGNYLPLSGGTVTGQTFFTSGLTITGDTIITDSTGTSTAIDTSTRQLVDSYSSISIDWRQRLLYNSAGNATINYDGAILYDSTSIPSVDWFSRQTYDDLGVLSIDWQYGKRRLYDVSSNESLDWDIRTLTKSDGATVSFDWENGILTGQTNIESSTISATTYQNLPNGYYDTTGITSSQSITWDKTYWGVSGLTNVDITLPSTTSKDGYSLIIKDEGGTAGTYRIRLTPTSGLIDGNTYIDMNINYMSLTFVARNNNWWII